MSTPTSYTGQWISRDILEDENLSSAKKLLLAVITNLTDPEKGCYAKNAQLASMVGIKNRTVQHHLEWLEINGYILIEYENTSSCTGRRIYAIPARCNTLHTPMSNITPPHVKHCTQEKNTLKNNKKDIYPFDEFWKLYPKKVDKQQAEKLWGKINGERKVILEDLKTRSWGDDKQFIMGPAKYLRNKRWEDEKEEKSKNQGYIHNAI